MKRAALGIRAHSGWGALVVLTRGASGFEVIERRRVAIAEARMAGGDQPYHFAKTLSLEKAERHVAACEAASERLAFTALEEIETELRSRDYVVAGCAILLASGGALTSLTKSLPKILGSHPLMHTAEGDFFRRAFWRASERLGIKVTGIRERDLKERAAALREEIAALGKSLGPPWTSDQKNATLAAMEVLGPL